MSYQDINNVKDCWVRLNIYQQSLLHAILWRKPTEIFHWRKCSSLVAAVHLLYDCALRVTATL